MKDKTFHINDTTIGIWREDILEDWETHEAIRMLMRRDGFSFHQDPETKKHHRSLLKYHHAGRRRDVLFLSRLSGRHIEIKFFDDVIRDNRNGPQYGFDKLAKMPYVVRKQTELILRKLSRLLVSLGFTDETERIPRLAIDQVMQHREKFGRFQGDRFYAQPPVDYNAKDADGRLLRDGQERYFWDGNGRLNRGIVFHNINSMWWVVTSRYGMTNVSSSYFFAWQPGMPLRQPVDRASKLRKALRKAVKELRFERAIVLRDLLAKLEPKQTTQSLQIELERAA